MCCLTVDFYLMGFNKNIQTDLEQITDRFSGDISVDHTTRILYATDASVYRQIPMAVTRPKNKHDIIELIEFAKKHNTSLIPRTAGTSLAGQVVGGGIVVDVGKYMNRILEINVKERWVRVEPGVIPDELNKELKPLGLFFSPETSTSNRCMIGGMVGNNACGIHSLVYGSTRDHLLAVRAILSDSSEVEFGEVTPDEFNKKCITHTLEGELYRKIRTYLSNPENQKEIREQFPDTSIKRRNTGYALDLLLDSAIFNPTKKKFNFSQILAGSEGTLAFFTELKLHLDPLPPPVNGLVCVHCNTLEEALHGNLIALKHKPRAVELMDRTIIELSKENITQKENRFFIQGNPEAILIVELAGENRNTIDKAATLMEKEMKEAGTGSHFPVIYGEDIQKVWSVRKAGLGLLSNMPGDEKPVAVVEDTAVKVADLPAYIAEFKKLLAKYKLKCAYNGHIGTGELHLRPVLNLKKETDVALFRNLATDTANLVKKYRGSLSGEHGDGRLRGEFIPVIIGDKNSALLREIKRAWDPENIFNQGKIFETPSMNSSLRYDSQMAVRKIDTAFDFSANKGYLASTEKCNGSGDCRKSAVIGGTMCPSYQATKDEKNTTRARANILREWITRSEKQNPFNHEEIFNILDLCLSCKGCKSECPSNVDMAQLKGEFLHQYYQSGKMPFRTRVMAHYSENYKIGALFPLLTNYFLKNGITSSLIKKMMGVAPERNMPLLYKFTLKTWLRKNLKELLPKEGQKGKIYFFVDEFTDYNDTLIGIRAVQLLSALGYEVLIPEHTISGRTLITKGLLKEAQTIAQQNVKTLKDIISDEIPLVGIEPGAILTFRDEYPDLLRGDQKKDALKLAASVFLFEEFIVREIRAGNILSEQFTNEKKTIRIHGHCQQKAIASTRETIEMLSLPENYEVEEIPSGCCGMAGAFGYEKEHYDLSMKIGELVLFPEIRKTDQDVLIVASGTSCRQQIKDGTQRAALHPVEVFFSAYKQMFNSLFV